MPNTSHAVSQCIIPASKALPDQRCTCVVLHQAAAESPCAVIAVGRDTIEAGRPIDGTFSRNRSETISLPPPNMCRRNMCQLSTAPTSVPTASLSAFHSLYKYDFYLDWHPPLNPYLLFLRAGFSKKHKRYGRYAPQILFFWREG